LVDNASTDNTSEVAQSCWLSLGAPAPLKLVREEEAGQMHARLRGIREAQYEFISFVDDDVWVCPSWVQSVYETMVNHPEVGCCGGFGEVEPPCELPSWFDAYSVVFTVGAQGEPGDVTKTRGWLWGSGLILRKYAWQRIWQLGFRPRLRGYSGSKSLAGGDDVEIVLALKLNGWRLWYEPSLRYRHAIKPDRLKWSSLRKWYRDYGKVKVIHDSYHEAQRPLPSLKVQFLRGLWPFRLACEVFYLLPRLRYLFEKNSTNVSEVLAAEQRLGSIIGWSRLKDEPLRAVKDIRSAAWARSLPPES
jgi:glycosyltransferase involved in cell wall biosynthesis